MAETPMPQSPLSDLKQADAQWLTTTLTRNGHLTSGSVKSVKHDPWRKSTFSYLARLKLEYSEGATGKNNSEPPRALVLKYNQPIGVMRRSPHYARREFIFHARLVPAMKGSHGPRCYDAVFDVRTGAYHFLLEDLSRTHVQPANPVPPALPGLARLMERVARFHAEWWNDARLGLKIGAPFREEHTSRRRVTLRKRMQKFLAAWGDRLATPRCLTLTQLTAVYPRVIERQADGPFTLIHGDLHFGNVLLTADAADCRLIDWENWEVAPATDDLARLLAMQCFAELRKRSERPLLQHYYRTLRAAGVRSYPWDVLWRDYRLSVIKHLSTPIYQCTNGVAPAIWWSDLERALAAYEDLDCATIVAELLRSSTTPS